MIRRNTQLATQDTDNTCVKHEQNRVTGADAFTQQQTWPAFDWCVAETWNVL